jgi:hypothetical protein
MFVKAATEEAKLGRINESEILGEKRKFRSY